MARIPPPQRPSSRRSVAVQRDCPPAWLWLSVGMLCGICISVLASVYGILPLPQPTNAVISTLSAPPSQPVETPPQTVVATTTPSQSAPKPTPQPAVQTDSKPVTPNPDNVRFEFYDVLPKNSVAGETELRPEDFPRAGDPITAPLPNTGEKGMYILQVASFRQQQDATHLQAYLIELGFQSSIQTAMVNGENWFRTRVGPFADEEQARQVQHKLAKNQFESLLMHY